MGDGTRHKTRTKGIYYRLTKDGSKRYMIYVPGGSLKTLPAGTTYEDAKHQKQQIWTHTWAIDRSSHIFTKPRDYEPFVVAPNDGFVYVIGSDEFPNKVKIGFTQDVDRRLRMLQTGSPVSLKVLAVFEGTSIDETLAHRHFADKRGKGEWFEGVTSEAVMEFLLASEVV